MKQSGKKSVYRSEPFMNTSKHSRAKLKSPRCRAKLGKTFVRDMYYSISHTFRDKNSQSQPISNYSFRVISKTENIFQNVFSQPPVNWCGEFNAKKKIRNFFKFFEKRHFFEFFWKTVAWNYIRLTSKKTNREVDFWPKFQIFNFKIKILIFILKF